MANHLDLEEQEQLDQLKHFWNTWGTPITAVLLVVMGGLAAWNGYQYWQNRQASQAAALLDAVEVAVQARDQARVELAVGDLKSKYAGTPQADMGAFASAKAMQDSGNLDAAKSALAWVAEHSSDAGYKAIAKLRLSAILLEQKDYASVLQQFSFFKLLRGRRSRGAPHGINAERIQLDLNQTPVLNCFIQRSECNLVFCDGIGSTIQ